MMALRQKASAHHTYRKINSVEELKREVYASFMIPREAIRELLVNAVAHRNYFSHASVEVCLFADRLEVWNPGEMPEGLPIDWLFEEHESIPFNELLAEPLYQTRYIERAGTGIATIVNACRDTGLPPPKFEMRHRFFVATIFRMPIIENSAVKSENRTAAAENRTANDENRTPAVGNRTVDARNRTVNDEGGSGGTALPKALRRLLLALRKDTVSTAELMVRLKLKSRGALSATYIKPALRDGIVEMLHRDARHTAWQAYRLTEKGLSSLERLNGETRIG
jgi:predicted HTH transcriptional regulator